MGLPSWPRELRNVLFLLRVPPQLNSEHGGGVDGSRQTARHLVCLGGPAWRGASLRGWRGASPTRGTAGAAASSGPRPPGCFPYFNQSAAPAGRASDGWLQSEQHGGSGVRHGVRHVLGFGSHPWGRRPPGSKRGGELSRQWAGGRRTQGWPGQGSGIGGESGEESTADSYRGPAGWWAVAGGSLHTAPWTHSLSVSNYDKWPRVRVAGWQLPPLREEQVFLALRLGALAPG